MDKNSVSSEEEIEESEDERLEESEEELEESEEESEEDNDVPSFSTVSLKVIKEISNVLISLKKEDGSALVNSEQANKLANLKFSNGEKILTMEERWFVYEIAWLLSQKGYDITYNYLSIDWEKVFGNYNIRKKMFFENPLLDKNKEKFLLDMEIFTNKSDVVVGLMKCKKCGSDSTISASVQSRSCDEMETIKVMCLMCKFRWTAQ